MNLRCECGRKKHKDNKGGVLIKDRKTGKIKTWVCPSCVVACYPTFSPGKEKVYSSQIGKPKRRSWMYS